MVSNGETEEEFDEEEIADGFDEEVLVTDELDDVDTVQVDETEEIDEEEVVAAIAVPEEEEDIADSADVELALDEVLAETIRRTSTPEDDDEVTGEIDTSIDPAETILPKQHDEFRCTSCRLLKKTSQLADQLNVLCRDCV